MKTIESIPHAERTFEALRSLGYDLNSSVADVVDNALSSKAKARKIAVVLKRRGHHFFCRISDDGMGMSDAELQEAMRLGAETSYDAGDLGKFGMGMKTASLAHCNVLTVISKAEGASVCGYRWDLSHVKKSQKWSLIQLSPEEVRVILKKENHSFPKHGTVVLWDHLELLDNEYDSFAGNKHAENYYYRLLGELKLHLRMVFHRFLDGTSTYGKKISLYVNGESLIPWDPFCRAEKNASRVPLKQRDAEFRLQGHKKPISIKAYVLPHKEAFSTPKAWNEAKGLLPWNDSQGYYIYRADRLIRFGGWHGTKAKDEHDKLARLSIDIDPNLDTEFRITVNKAKVQFPEPLYYHLKNTVNPIVIRQAQKQYRRSSERMGVKNRLRKQADQLSSISRQLLEDNRIRTVISKGMGGTGIKVINPGGEFLSNKIQEFLKAGTRDDFQVVSGKLENGHLWRIVCSNNEKFKVIVNANHPFYLKIYNGSANRAVTSAIDALIFSLAFAELFNRNDKNSSLFDTYKSVCAEALRKLTKESLV